jgi:hypothetical protein
MSKMRAAADKAIQLDPLLAEAHGALAVRGNSKILVQNM